MAPNDPRPKAARPEPDVRYVSQGFRCIKNDRTGDAYYSTPGTGTVPVTVGMATAVHTNRLLPKLDTHR